MQAAGVASTYLELSLAKIIVSDLDHMCPQYSDYRSIKDKGRFYPPFPIYFTQSDSADCAPVDHNERSDHRVDHGWLYKDVHCSGNT